VNGYLPAFVGFLGALLFAMSLSFRTLQPGEPAPFVRNLMHWLALAFLAFTVVVYGLALGGVAVFA
jgi:hypothetical protein